MLSVPVQLIACKDRPWNDLLCVEQNVKQLTQTSVPVDIQASHWISLSMIVIMPLLLAWFYGRCSVQPVLTGTSSWELEDFVGAKFYCRMPLLTATSTLPSGLRRRR